MPVVKIRREEMDLVKEAAERKAHRTNSTFVIRQERVEIAREKPSKTTSSSGNTKPQPK
jgi:hypothetical protein